MRYCFASTATAVQNIAAVVGYGSATGCASCTVMAVMDMTTPSQPQPLSFTVLSGTPSAVVLNGNTAIVGYSSDASDLFDLTNPAHPQFLGQLFYVGGSLFVYNGGELFSTGAVPGVPGSALGGVHAAQLTPKTILCNGTSVQPAADVFINNTQTNADDITVLNPPQTIPAMITLHSSPACPATQVTLAASPSGRVTLSQTVVSLTNGASATVTITPTAVSQSVDDVAITASVNGAQVGMGNMTVVNVMIPAVTNADTPTGMSARIPPTATTPIQVTVQPDLGTSGQVVTLAKLNNSATNGDFTIGGSTTQTLTTTTTVNLTGATQTAPTGGTGGGNAGNLNLVAQVRGQNAVLSSGFSVAAIPINFSTSLIGNYNDGNFVGLQANNQWTSDSGNIADLDQVQRSEQVQSTTHIGVFSGVSTSNIGHSSFLPGTLGSTTDTHAVAIALLTGNGTLVVSQAFIFNDARSGTQNAIIPKSGFTITHTATLNQNGSVTLTTNKVGAAATANGYSAITGAGGAQNSATDTNGVITFP